MTSTQGLQGPLYSLRQVLIATAIGSPVAGAILLASNYRSLGKPSASTPTLVTGIIVTTLVVLIALSLPQDVPRPLLSVAYIALTGAVSTGLQGRSLGLMRGTGASLYSTWRVLGIALLCLAGVLIFVLGLSVVLFVGRRLTSS